MKKVIVRIKGGLGNQLFCYAAARRLALMNDAELVIDHVTGFLRDREYRRKYALDNFSIPARKATPPERLEPFERYRRSIAKLTARQKPFQKRKYVEQEGSEFDPRLLDFHVSGTIYLDGLWQSERYFKDVKKVIRQDLQITPPRDAANREMAEKIASCNAVCIHVRWFDNSSTFHGNLNHGYYANAIQYILEKVSAPHFFLFSDNPEAALKMIALPAEVTTFVRHNCGAENNAYADLWLMTQCKHIITANSTFSWWGAWLGEANTKIIITPNFVLSGNMTASGFNGAMPDRWIINPAA